MGFPNDFAATFIQANQARAVSADRQENVVAVDDAGAVIAAAARRAFVGFTAEERDAKILFETDSPQDFAIFSAKAAKLAFAGLHVKTVVVENWCAARAWSPFVLVHFAVGRLPELLACSGVDEVGDFLAVLGIQISELAVSDNRGRESAADFFAPESFWFAGV